MAANTDYNIIETIFYDELKNTNIKLQDVFSGHIKVLVIKNFLADFDIITAKAFCNTIPDKHKTFFIKDAGWCFPTTFSLIDLSKGKNLWSYKRFNHLETTDFNAFLKERLEKRLLKVFYDLSGFEIASLKYANEALNNFSVRVLYTGSNGMDKHRGINLKNIYDAAFYNYVNDDLFLPNGQLGFFITIQPASLGGILKVFLDNSDDENFISVKTDEGDLVIIDEYNTWHEVSPPRGSRNRISIGGFLAYNKNKSKIYVWT